MLHLEAVTLGERREAELEAAGAQALSLSLGPGWIRNEDECCWCSRLNPWFGYQQKDTSLYTRCFQVKYIATALPSLLFFILLGIRSRISSVKFVVFPSLA